MLKILGKLHTALYAQESSLPKGSLNPSEDMWFHLFFRNELILGRKIVLVNSLHDYYSNSGFD